MESTDIIKEKDTKKKLNIDLKNKVQNNLTIFFLTTLLTGFIAGFITYGTIVDVSGQVLLIKDSYVLKKDIVGRLLRIEAISETDHLIEIGSSNINNENATRIWVMRVLAFIHCLNLEKDSELNGIKMSATEADIRYILQDPSFENQRQKILGILLGFKSAYKTEITIP